MGWWHDAEGFEPLDAGSTPAVPKLTSPGNMAATQELSDTRKL